MCKLRLVRESQRSHSTTELVAFHKRKRIFLKLKDLATEDPGDILICEFNGQNFSIFQIRYRISVVSH